MKRTITLVLSLFICLVSFSQNTLFSSGFEGPGFDEGWEIGMTTTIDEVPYDYPGGLDPWEMWDLQTQSDYVHSGNSAAYIGGTFSLENKYDWLMSPQITVPENAVTNVNYWMWYYSSNYITYFYIMVYDIEADTWELGYSLTDPSTYLLYSEEYSFDLSPWEGKDIKVAFVKRGTYQFAMDDINCISVSNGNDLALSAILAPNNENGCTLTANEEIKITVENTGTSDVSTFDVQYSINYTTLVTETVNEEINVGETFDYTFNELADLSAFGDYIIDVEVIVEDDQNPDNNGMLTEVISTDAVITLEILTDQWSPDDNSWVLTDSENNIVASAGIGELPKEELYTKEICVYTSECYSFTMLDEFGDGLSGDGGPPGYLNIFYDGELVGGFTIEEANFGTEFTVDEIGDGCTVNVRDLNSHDIKAYPNPVSSTLFLENLADIQSVKIFDILGREYTQHIEGTNNRISVDFSNLENGLYLVKINSKNHEYNTFLIQKR